VRRRGLGSDLYRAENHYPEASYAAAPSDIGRRTLGTWTHPQNQPVSQRYSRALDEPATALDELDRRHRNRRRESNSDGDWIKDRDGNLRRKPTDALSGNGEAGRIPTTLSMLNITENTPVGLPSDAR
jgi:hypothetical protein